MSFKLIVSVTLFFAASAFGQEGTCREDVQKFCSGVEKGGGRILKCLKEHEAQLSPACRARGTEMRDRFKSGREACQGDTAKFCSGVKAGGGRIVKCLKEHKSELSADCSAQFKR